MKKLWFNSIVLVVLCLVISCGNKVKQTNTSNTKNESKVTNSTANNASVVQDTVGSTPAAVSNNTNNEVKIDSTKPMKVVEHNAPNQSVIDSVKAAKAKLKSK